MRQNLRTARYWGSLLLIALAFTAAGSLFLAMGKLFIASQATVETLEASVCPTGTRLQSNTSSFSDPHHGVGTATTYTCCNEKNECTGTSGSGLLVLFLGALLPVSLVATPIVGIGALVHKRFGKRAVLWSIVLACFVAIVALLL